MGKFLTKLVTRRLGDGDNQLTEELIYRYGGVEIVVPIGFISDFASIPRIAWTLVGPPGGAYAESAVIHDYLLQYPMLGERKLTRKDCDGIFLDGMKSQNIFWLKRKVMWASVRAGSWVSWNKYRKRDK